MFKAAFGILVRTLVVMALIGGFAVFLLMLKIFLRNFLHLLKRYREKAKKKDNDL